MHPTIDEQLEGIARLIERTLERHPDDPSGERLRTAAGTLRRIAGSWAEMLPYFAWDNAATLSLLESLGDPLPEEILARVDPLAARAAHDRNKELRRLLAEAIRALPPESTDARMKIAAHLRERIARDPFTGRTRR